MAWLSVTLEEAAVEEIFTVPPPLACVKAPFSEIFPPEIKLIVPVPTPTVPKTMAPAVVKETVLEPLLESETAPVSRLFWVKVMGLAPTVKEEVPPTLRTPF